MKTLVVKLGGHALDHLEVGAPVLADLASDVAALRVEGTSVVVVHGGGPQIGALLSSLAMPSSFVEGLRVTDDATMEVVATALSFVNLRIVATLNTAGLKSVGLSGADAGMLYATALGDPWGRAATKPVVDPTLVRDLLHLGYTPVLSSVGLDEDGGLLNCNADTMAGAMAAALGTELVLLSDVDQVRANPDDESSVIESLTRSEANAMLENGTAREGMRPKLTAALDALDGGASRVRLANGRRAHALAQLLSGVLASTEVTA
ncbi:MAG TPA: acetylglutamate kinase [Acidimicrobiales bacterium]|nr:acetylglutamate kinase [Acidimicrobiales bacterium]